jgi:hypothetical protein
MIKVKLNLFTYVFRYEDEDTLDSLINHSLDYNRGSGNIILK